MRLRLYIVDNFQRLIILSTRQPSDIIPVSGLEVIHLLSMMLTAAKTGIVHPSKHRLLWWLPLLNRNMTEVIIFHVKAITMVQYQSRALQEEGPVVIYIIGQQPMD